MSVLQSYDRVNLNSWYFSEWNDDSEYFTLTSNFSPFADGYYWQPFSYDGRDYAFGTYGFFEISDETNQPVDGVVVSRQGWWWNTSTETWLWSYRLTGFSVQLEDFIAVTKTVNKEDDQLLLAQILAGDDLIILSEFDDNMSGFSGNDKLHGGSGKDTLYGGSGNDSLRGESGNDKLYGDAGKDTLTGGTGSDLLYGGADSVRDVFIFNSIAESKTGSARDKVYDFRTKVDDLDLRGIDANTKLTGDQKFGFSTTTAKANSVWYKTANLDGNTKTKEIIVYGDVNGDAKADFEIGLMGVSSITATDFLL